MVLDAKGAGWQGVVGDTSGEVEKQSPGGANVGRVQGEGLCAVYAPPPPVSSEQQNNPVLKKYGPNRSVRWARPSVLT